MKHWKETAEVFGRLARSSGAGRRAALATVVRIEGSAYRRPGAKLLVEEDGSTVGSISGGCLEGDVREIGLAVLGDSVPRRHRYDTGADENAAWGLGVGCAGSVELFVQPATGREILQAVERVFELFEEGRPFALCTQVGESAAAGGAVVVSAGGTFSGSAGDAAVDREIARQSGQWISSRASRIHAVDGTEIVAELLAASSGVEPRHLREKVRTVHAR